MAHYALIDSDNVVVQVITGVDETVTQNDNGTPVGGSTEAWEQFYQNQPWHQGLFCKRTSYNNKIRKQFAGIGMSYDPNRDEFVDIQPYPSWQLDENNDWQPPVNSLPKPNNDKEYYWDEIGFEWRAIVTIVTDYVAPSEP
jgi:hypothetical protein